ncbi:MAG: SBBP repeat-containing protein, partial [Terriglobia bacterium]
MKTPRPSVLLTEIFRAVGVLAILLCVLAVTAAGRLRAAETGDLGPRPANASKSPQSVSVQASPPVHQNISTRIKALYAQIPLRFEPNQGQADSRVKFMARTPGYGLFLTEDGAVLAFGSASKTTRAGETWVRIKWLGSDSLPFAVGRAKLTSQSNYFLGNDPSRWRTHIPNYARVDFQDVYPGIDLSYYGNPRQLEYDFRIAPGKDVNSLRFSVSGPSGRLPLRLDARGDLVAEIPGVNLRFLPPTAYQEIAQHGKRVRRTVPSRYALEDRGRVGIIVDPYDRSRPLVVDPVLLYSTYLGGSGSDSATGVAVDSSGDAFITGGVTSVNFPTANPVQKSSAGRSDAFMAELNPAGTSLIYSTYVGGSAFDKGTAIAVDSSGNAYATGYTSSPDFPVTPKSFQTTYQGSGKPEAFVIKLNSGGSSLAYSTYLGGSGGDFGQGIAVDPTGDAYVTGSTQSSDFPVAKPLQAIIGGGSDAFVTELNPAGSSLVYSTFLGGAGSDSGQAIAVDSAGEAVIAGFTFSINFPTQGAVQPSSGGGADTFVAKLSAGGSALLYSTYLGGSGGDRAFGLAL